MAFRLGEIGLKVAIIGNLVMSLVTMVYVKAKQQTIILRTRKFEIDYTVL